MTDRIRSRTRGGLATGLVFLALGLFFLLRNLGTIDDAWSFYGNYWPGLIVLMGLAKILEFWRGTGGRMLRFGEFTLLLIIILTGLVVSTLPLRLRIPLGGRHVSVRDYYGSSFSFTQEKDHAVAPNIPLTVRNAQGSVVLVPGADGQLRFKLRKTVYARSEDEAKKTADRIQLVVNSTPEGIVAEVNRDQFGSTEGRFETSFEIGVPVAISTQIINQNGDVVLEGLTGSQVVSTSYGRLSLSRIQGDLKAANKYGDTRISSITGSVQLDAVRSGTVIEEVSGDVTATNSYGLLDVSGVAGTVKLTNNYNEVRASRLKQGLEVDAPGSSVTVESVEGPVKIRSSHKEVSIDDARSRVDLDQDSGSLRLRNIGGEVVIRASNCSLKGSSLKGPLNVESVNTTMDLDELLGDAVIRNKLKTVSVQGFSGALDIVNENGRVTLAPTAPLRKPLLASTSSADLELILPEAAVLQIAAHVQRGDIACDFPGLEVKRSGSDIADLQGRIGMGGPLVKLENRYGDVIIRKATGNK